MKKLHFTVVLLLVALVSGAQDAVVSGTITGVENGRVTPLPFVSVFVKGTTVGAMTEMDGRYELKVGPGSCVIVVSYVGYEPAERALTIEAGSTMAVDFTLTPVSTLLGATEVVRERRLDTETAVNMDIRKSEQVVSGMGRQQIARSQDRTAGDVVKRIPGVTLLGDRFIMIRGLADRYNAVQLNGVTAPSSEADKRAFSFDAIPSGALDRVMIHKTAGAELPGDFAGGVVRISTLGVPQENETRIVGQLSSRAGTTFEPVLGGMKSPTDALAFDRSLRPLPETFPGDLNKVTDPDKLAQLGRELPNAWSTSEHMAMPDLRLGFLLARRFGKDGGTRYGNVTALEYSNTTTAYEATTANFNAYSAETGRHDTIYSYRDNENLRNYRLSLLSNWTMLASERTKLEFLNLFNQLGEDRTTVRTGRDVGAGNEVHNLAFRWQQRSIYSGQFHGHHDLGEKKAVIDWVAGYGRAVSTEPDYRRVRSTRPLGSTDGSAPFQIVIPPTASTNDAGRFHSELHENVFTGRTDVEKTLTCKNTAIVAKIKTGIFAEMRDRDFSARWMSFAKANFTQFDNALLYTTPEVAFSDANINTTTGFKLVEGTNPSDRYTASNTLLAAYAGSSIAFGKLYTLVVGVRAERDRQQLTSTRYNGERVSVDAPELSLLPSLNASWNISERSLVRAAWSRTLNRPEFRELAPFEFYDFSTNSSLSGDPDLKSASISNLDARWEHYPAANEVVSAGVFHKAFTDPIELFYVASTGGGARSFQYGNAAFAQSVGVELEMRRTLAFISDAPWSSHWGVVLNGAFIHTTVDLGDDAVGQTQNRPMTGQSPYVANAGIYFENTETRTRFSILANQAGRRLYAAGSYLTPDVYEMPRCAVDLTFSKGLGKRMEMKVGVQDLLNQRTRLEQDSDRDGDIDVNDEEIMSFRKGSYFTAGLSFRF